MVNYKKTIVENNSEYVGKHLLLTDLDREKLYTDEDGNRIQLLVDKTGKPSFYKVKKNGKKREKIKTSLRRIGEKYLDLKDPPVPQMLRYFALPEMEVERIFNCLRYKYIRATKHGNKKPDEYFDADYNDTFKALIQTTFRGVKKKNLPKKWKKILRESNFKPEVKINIASEKKALTFIINYLRLIFFNTKGDSGAKKRLYKELISIKPGFHEKYIDKMHGGKHKEKLSKKDSAKRRTAVLKMIHNINNRMNFTLNGVNYEINKKNYLTYATCNITEGPFVFRKNLSVSYFDELKNFKSKEDVKKLENSFFILDYQGKIDSKEDLIEFLSKAKKFRRFLH